MGSTQILPYWKLFFHVFKNKQFGFPVLFFPSSFLITQAIYLPWTSLISIAESHCMPEMSVFLCRSSTQTVLLLFHVCMFLFCSMLSGVVFLQIYWWKSFICCWEIVQASVICSVIWVQDFCYISLKTDTCRSVQCITLPLSARGPILKSKICLHQMLLNEIANHQASLAKIQKCQSDRL